MDPAKDGDAWEQVIATPGFIGKDGMGKASCSDAYTPIGAFTIDEAVGRHALQRGQRSGRLGFSMRDRKRASERL